MLLKVEITTKEIDEARMKKHEEQYIIAKKDKKKGVILPVDEYQELLENLHDLAVIAERRDESMINFEEVKERLKKDGLL